MLLNAWSIGLLLCTASVLFIVALAFVTAIRVLLYWDAESDSEKQIELEGRTWLSASLVQYALVVQGISLVMLILAAEEFSGMIAGAMCATGSFLANEYGVPLLCLKISGLFLYGFWIVLHRLDMSSEFYPLIRIKYLYLLALLPLLLLDSYWLFRYLAELKPDIITSCCGIVFSDKSIKGNFLLISVTSKTQYLLFYSVAFLLFGFGVYVRQAERKVHSGLADMMYGILWCFFFILSLIVITTYFSSYIYAMPYHKCPFDMLQSHYNYIGVPIYATLFGAAFCGMSGSFVGLFGNHQYLGQAARKYQSRAIIICLWLLPLFVVLLSYSPIKYWIYGGES